MFCGGPSHVLKTAAYDPVTHKGLPRPTAPNEASNVFLRLPGDYGDTKETEKAVDFHNEHCGESCHKDCKLDQAFREGEENLKKWSFQDAHAACNGESDDHADILLESLSHDTGENISTTNKSKLLLPFAQDPRGREVKEHECIICGENIGEDEPSVRWKTQRQFPLKIIDRENGVVPQLKGPLEKLKDYDKWQKRYENYLDGAQAKWKTTPATEFNEISTGHLPEGQRDSNAVARRSTFDDGFEPMHAKPCFKMFTSPYGCPAARNRDPEDFEHGTGGKGHFKPSTNKTSHWKQRYAIAPKSLWDRIEYMTPREILKTHSVNQGELWDTIDQHNSVAPELGHPEEDINDEDAFWKIKRLESRDPNYDPKHNTSLHERIQKGGLQKPISVIHYQGPPERNIEPKEIFEGHHRLIAAYDIAPDKPIPVRIMHDNPYLNEDWHYQHGKF